jgi:hypothetical protein
MHAVYDSAYVENEGMHQVVAHTLISNIFQQCSKMPIDLQLCVQRVLVARLKSSLKRTAFDAWRRDLARRKLVVGRLWEHINYNGALVRAVFRFWAKESSCPRCGWSSEW